MADARERVWTMRLRRRLGINPVCAPITAETTRIAHDLVKVRASPYRYAEEDEYRREVERLGAELRAAERRAEDEAAERLGLPPRP